MIDKIITNSLKRSLLGGGMLIYLMLFIVLPGIFYVPIKIWIQITISVSLVVIGFVAIVLYMGSELKDYIHRNKNKAAQKVIVEMCQKWLGIMIFTYKAAACYIALHILQLIVYILLRKEYGLESQFIWSSSFMFFSLLIAFSGTFLKIILNSVFSDNDETLINKLAKTFVYKIIVLIVGTAGASLAVFASPLVAFLQQGGVGVEISTDTIIANMVMIGISIILILFYPKSNAISYKFFEGDGKDWGKGIRSIFIMGMAVPSLIVSALEGLNNYGAKVEDLRNKAKVAYIENDINYTQNKFVYVDSTGQRNPLFFINSVYATELSKQEPATTNSYLDNALNKPSSRLSGVVNVFSKDRGVKDYTISLAKINNKEDAKAYRDICMGQHYKLSGVQVIEITDDDYRVIFPSLENKIQRGEAAYKLGLLDDYIKENPKNIPECKNTNLSILRF